MICHCLSFIRTKNHYKIHVHTRYDESFITITILEMSSLLRQLSSGRGAFRKASVISFRAHLSCSVNTDEDVPLPKQKINFLSSKGTSIKKNLHEWGYKSYRLKQIKRYVNECGVSITAYKVDFVVNVYSSSLSPRRSWTLR